MLAHSFLIESSSKLLVTRTGIKVRTSSISGLWFPWPIYMFFFKWEDVKFGLWMIKTFVFSSQSELIVYQWSVVRPSSPVVVHTFNFEYLWSQLASLDQILCSITGVGEMLHTVLGQIGSKVWFPGNRKPPLTYNGKTMFPLFLSCFWSDPFYTCR